MPWQVRKDTKLPVLTIKDLITIIKGRQTAEFDIIIIISGRRGAGKSTLAWKICRKIGKYEIEKDGITYPAGGFKPIKDMIYTKEEAQKLFKEQKYGIILGDESIVLGYNRNFAVTSQQELIKILNQYRSNYNCLILCVPNFYDLDQDIRELCNVRIDLARRGLGVIHFPLDRKFKNDPWDTLNNAKIEQSWSEKGIDRPQFNRLTTFKSLVVFGPLSLKEKKRYEKVRDYKRLKANVSIGIDGLNLGFYSRLVGGIKKGNISKKEMDLMLNTAGIEKSKGYKELSKILKENGSKYTIINYVRKKEKQMIKKKEIENKIERQKLLGDL